jgi:hypothetical protein
MWLLASLACSSTPPALPRPLFSDPQGRQFHTMDDLLRYQAVRAEIEQQWRGALYQRSAPGEERWCQTDEGASCRPLAYDNVSLALRTDASRSAVYAIELGTARRRGDLLLELTWSRGEQVDRFGVRLHEGDRWLQLGDELQFSSQDIPLWTDVGTGSQVATALWTSPESLRAEVEREMDTMRERVLSRLEAGEIFHVRPGPGGPDDLLSVPLTVEEEEALEQDLVRWSQGQRQFAAERAEDLHALVRQAIPASMFDRR